MADKGASVLSEYAVGDAVRYQGKGWVIDVIEADGTAWLTDEDGADKEDDLDDLEPLWNGKKFPQIDLFKTVYAWGRYGVVVDHTCPVYRQLIKEVKNEKA